MADVREIEADVAIIGAGTAGLTARRSAERSGARAVMIDPGPYGTTCARVGCMPSKLLIAAADAAHEARHMGAFGIRGGEGVAADGPAVMDRVRRERDRFVGFVLRAVDEHLEAGRLIRGRARFTDEQSLRVEDDTGRHIAQVRAAAFVVATGSSPFIPPPFRGLGDRALVNDDIFSWTDLPESLLIAGTGVIGMELGQALHRLGVRVCIVGIGGRIGPLSDPAVKAEARRIFQSELDLHPDYQLQSIHRSAGGVSVRFTSEGVAHSGTYEAVLIAAGRRPRLAGLGLEAAGLDPLPRFHHRTCQLGDSNIFIAGDASGHIPLLHEAADEGHIAGANAARWPSVLAGHRRTPLAVVFSDPQMAVVGMPITELPPGQWHYGEVDYGDQGRARVMNKHAGLVRIYGDKEHGTLLAAEMLGPRVEHTAHLLSWAIQQRMTVERALEMPFYHPVVEEGIRTALRDLQTNLRFAPPLRSCCEEDGPGT